MWVHIIVSVKIASSKSSIVKWLSPQTLNLVSPVRIRVEELFRRILSASTTTMTSIIFHATPLVQLCGPRLAIILAIIRSDVRSSMRSVHRQDMFNYDAVNEYLDNSLIPIYEHTYVRAQAQLVSIIFQRENVSVVLLQCYRGVTVITCTL